jgi:hypothetical protein
MRNALLLSCSLALLAACEDRVIGSAHDQSGPDGGPSSLTVDRTLARYAKELDGAWDGPPDSNVRITFTHSEDQPRGGKAVIEANPEIVCFLFTCPFDADAGRPRAPRIKFEVEYWLLRLTAAGALVTLPDPELPISVNCVYVPASTAAGSSPQLECGPGGLLVMTRAEAP